MLLERYDKTFLLEHLAETSAWRPFPRAVDRDVWEGLLAHPLNRERRAWLLGQAEALLRQPWPQLPASLYTEFARTGNRSHFQEPYFRRRQDLAVLVLAECMEGQGRLLDEIANGFWLISEEATWCVPAHAERIAGDVLPRQDRQSVDLFACETAMVLAEAYYLLRDELEGFSPALCHRLRREVERRVISPVERRDDFHWFNGFNNWSPWCSSNVLGAAMYLLDDNDRLADLALRLMGVVDRFLAGYGPDGGCDEGPGYWGVAAGAMLVFLELLHSRTAGAVDIYDQPLIRNMGRFFADVHIHGPWFVNFADAPARHTPRRDVTYRYGERVGLPELQNLALLGARDWDPRGLVWPPIGDRQSGGDLPDMLRELFWVPADARPGTLCKRTSVWLPDLQVLVARESATGSEGLFLAAKGGHNGESHNHNDIGQFILYLNGDPAIIDVGVETYTRQTFSNERYEIWCIRSSGHNVPLVNDVEQAPGEDHRATEVAFSQDGETQRLEMYLEKAYPEAASLIELRREFVLRAGKAASATVSDAYQVGAKSARIRLPLFAVREVTDVEPGLLAVHCQPRRLLVRYDPDVLRVSIGDIRIRDPRLRAAWGDQLRRITFETVDDAPSGGYQLLFEEEKEAMEA